ncbi:MFS transporter, partial [Ralstonia pickettii]|nr:MFS transporter [Ralstonia pickettii]
MKTSATAATQDMESAAAEKGLTRVTGTEWRSLSLAGLGWTFESYDSFLLSLLLPTLALQFGLSKAQLGMFTSVTAAGQIVGGILFGFVSDRIGRV